jgi:hypothetical protein
VNLLIRKVKLMLCSSQVKKRYNWIWALATAVTILASWMLIGSSKAGAISGAGTYFPDTSPTGQDKSYAIVQVTGSSVENANSKMKARSTIANIYVPKSLEGQSITLKVINGCHGTIRDNDTWAGDTIFKVKNRTSPADIMPYTRTDSAGVCVNTKDILVTFIATPIKPGPEFAHSYLIDKGVAYNVYQFQADGEMIETGNSARYLNAFGLESSGGVVVGISSYPQICNFSRYPQSCPGKRLYNGSYESWVYTSFYGPSPAWALPNYSQRIKISSSCPLSTGGISFYDLDANTSNLDQNNLNIKLFRAGVQMTVTSPNGTVFDKLDINALKFWQSGVPGLLNAHPDIAGQIDSGGNDNEYLDIPGGFPMYPTADPMFSALGSFELNVEYELQINNIDSDNAFQILPNYPLCQLPEESVISCESFSQVAKTAGYVELSFNIKNNTTFDWVPSGNRYDIGVVDTGFAGSKLNGAQTTYPSRGVGGNGPPDHQSALYLRDSTNGRNNAWHRDSYNRDTSNGLPANQAVERYGTTANIPAGGVANFSVWVQVPSSGTKNYGIRMLSRDSRFTPYSWMDWSESCAFSVNPEGVGGLMSCNALSSATGAPGTYMQISFNIRNHGTYDWVPSGNKYDIGVVDTSFSGAKLNDIGTTTPARGLGGDGPPDHQSASYVQDNRNGINNAWHRDAYNRDSSAGPANQFVERYGTTANIGASSNTSFSVWVQVPASGTKNYGIRMLVRGDPLFPYSWMEWSDSCAFSVSATIPNLLSCRVPPIPVTVGESFYLRATLQNENTSTVNVSGGASYTLTKNGVTIATGNGRPYDIDTDQPLQFPIDVFDGDSVPIRSETEISVASPGDYDVFWDITIASGVKADEDCGKIIYGAVSANNNPYVRFYGNDVVAGGGFGLCTNSTEVDVRGYGTFGNGVSTHANYKGSAVELAVFATGRIEGVLPGAQNITSRTALTELSFANDSPNGDFGGGLGT